MYGKILDGIKVVGFPIVMCFVFISWEAGWLPSQSRETLRVAREHDVTTKELAKALDSFRSASRFQVLLTSCLAYARTPEVQQKCIEQYQVSMP